MAESSLNGLENTVGKGEIARYEHFLLFPVFSSCVENFLPFSLNFKLSSANSFSLEESKICHSGKNGVKHLIKVIICVLLKWNLA